MMRIAIFWAGWLPVVVFPFVIVFLTGRAEAREEPVLTAEEARELLGAVIAAEKVAVARKCERTRYEMELLKTAIKAEMTEIEARRLIPAGL